MSVGVVELFEMVDVDYGDGVLLVERKQGLVEGAASAFEKNGGRTRRWRLQNSAESRAGLRARRDEVDWRDHIRNYFPDGTTRRRQPIPGRAIRSGARFRRRSGRARELWRTR